jgi:hypothetical protein
VGDEVGDGPAGGGGQAGQGADVGGGDAGVADEREQLHLFAEQPGLLVVAAQAGELPRREYPLLPV